jgi:hypothetical protein
MGRRRLIGVRGGRLVVVLRRATKEAADEKAGLYDIDPDDDLKP